MPRGGREAYHVAAGRGRGREPGGTRGVNRYRARIASRALVLLAVLVPAPVLAACGGENTQTTPGSAVAAYRTVVSVNAGTVDRRTDEALNLVRGAASARPSGDADVAARATVLGDEVLEVLQRLDREQSEAPEPAQDAHQSLRLAVNGIADELGTVASRLRARPDAATRRLSLDAAERTIEAWASSVSSLARAAVRLAIAPPD